MRAALSADWLEDLSDYHEEIVADACRKWRRSENKRPTPADIRKLCYSVTISASPPMARRLDHQEKSRLTIADRQDMATSFRIWQRMFNGEIPYPPYGVNATDYVQQILRRERE